MTDLEPIPPASDLPVLPAAPPAEAGAPEVSTNFPAALTGLAGLVVGGLLLGKKGGLLAGLVGVGARVLLDKERAARPPHPADPAPETPAPAAEIPAPTNLPEASETPVQESAETPPPTIIAPPVAVAAPESEVASPSPASELPPPEPVLTEPAHATAEQSPAEIPIPAAESTFPAGSEVPVQKMPPPEIITSQPEPPLVADPVMAAEVPCDSGIKREELETPATINKSDATESRHVLSDPLDEALEHSEGFRNLGETWRQRPASPVDIAPPATLLAPPPSVPQEAAPVFSSMPEAELSLPPNFVQWPSSATTTEPTSATSADPVFENYLASMFKEAASELSPPVPVPAPPVREPLAAPTNDDDLAAFPSLPNLTPEDIWRLAAETPDSLQKISTPSTPAQTTPHAEPTPAPASSPDSLVKMLGITSEGSPTPPLPPAPKAAKPAIRVQGAPTFEDPELQPMEAPPLSPFAAPYQPPPVVVPPLSFPPRTIQLVDPGTTARKRRIRYDKFANFLLILGLLYVAYVFRAPLIKQWNGTTSEPEPAASSTRPAPPSPPASVVIKPPVEETPPPPPAPEPVSTTPEPAVVLPDAPKIEVRPAASLPELPAEPDSTPEPPNAQASPEDAARREAEGVVKKFLTSTNVGALLPLILNSDKLGETVRKYYVSDAVPPTPFDNIVMDSGARVPETNTRAFLFRVRSPKRPQGFPVCTEETPQGFKIEWEAFVQCRDRTQATFWKSADATPTRLFVVLKRSHYFEEDVPNLEDYDCFSISSPNPDEDPVYAFAKKNSAFTQKFRSRLTWEASYFIVATFSHVKSSNGSSHVEIEDIERFSWRNLGN